MRTFYNIYLFCENYFYMFLTFVCGIVCRRKCASEGILFLENFPVENAGYQYRASKWCKHLQENGFRAEVVTIIESKKTFDSFDPQRFLVLSIRKRFRQCLYARKFKTVIVRRELLQFNDYGNLFMDKFLQKIHPNVILDFDDDISAAKKQPRTVISLYGKLLQENGNKFNDSLRLYKRFIVGSEYLKRRVLTENKTICEKDICVIPTCVDYDETHAKVYGVNNDEIIMGWIGGNHNLHYLDMLVEPLNRLSIDYKIKLLVVSGRDYVSSKALFPIENQKWNLKKEKDLIRKFDIGLMPIEDNLIGRGKCGFKLLQYMGLGVVGIATDITINGEIISNGENGFLVKSDNSNWYDVLKKALDLREKFNVFSNNAIKTVAREYTFKTNLSKYLEWVS